MAEYVDNDTSATKQRGVGTDWHRMLCDLDADEFDTLLVTEISPLTRTSPTSST